MIRLGKTAKTKPDVAIQEAKDFFGPKGYGLTMVDETPTWVKFEGSGGEVEIGAVEEDKGTSVEIVSREWDTQAKEFMSKLR